MIELQRGSGICPGCAAGRVLYGMLGAGQRLLSGFWREICEVALASFASQERTQVGLERRKITSSNSNHEANPKCVTTPFDCVA
uniref:Uncharacterized protein n=1 Tax=Kalanchoe fedtschenkoi TaxID=63787 RepID=A0A7N0VFA5_KALFE